jgi:hypothetical protein
MANKMLPEPPSRAAYDAALLLVGQIDQTLTAGLSPYRTTTGQRLTTLDEVVRAILDDTLLTENPDLAAVPKKGAGR